MGMKVKSNHFRSEGQGGEVDRLSKKTGHATQSGGRPSFPTKDSQIRHMFRNEPGHIIDTPQNRNTIATIASDEHNFIGTDKHGNRWYSKTISGKQYWVKVRKGIVSDCGMNDEPRKINQIFDRKDKNK